MRASVTILLVSLVTLLLFPCSYLWTAAAAGGFSDEVNDAAVGTGFSLFAVVILSGAWVAMEEGL